PRIEIVNLHVLHGTCEYIKSYERERAMMVVPIVANVLAQHKRTSASKGRCSGASPVTGCVPLPPTAAHPTKPLKSVMVEGSTPGAGKNTWNRGPSGPSSCKPPGIG